MSYMCTRWEQVIQVCCAYLQNRARELTFSEITNLPLIRWPSRAKNSEAEVEAGSEKLALKKLVPMETNGCLRLLLDECNMKRVQESTSRRAYDLMSSINKCQVFAHVKYHQKVSNHVYIVRFGKECAASISITFSVASIERNILPFFAPFAMPLSASPTRHPSSLSGKLGI